MLFIIYIFKLFDFIQVHRKIVQSKKWRQNYSISIIYNNIGKFLEEMLLQISSLYWIGILSKNTFKVKEIMMKKLDKDQ